MAINFRLFTRSFKERKFSEVLTLELPGFTCGIVSGQNRGGERLSGHGCQHPQTPRNPNFWDWSRDEFRDSFQLPMPVNPPRINPPPPHYYICEFSFEVYSMFPEKCELTHCIRNRCFSQIWVNCSPSHKFTSLMVPTITDLGERSYCQVQAHTFALFETINQDEVLGITSTSQECCLLLGLVNLGNT